jgi:prepilin-type N-terminal cleavage/methylation domain-containing protein
MFTKLHQMKARGFTLVEMMIAVGVFSVASIALGTLFMFSIRSFGQMLNYAELDAQNRHAVDILTREIRQAQFVRTFINSAQSSSLTLLTGGNYDVTYTFDGNNKVMTRTVGANSEILLSNCTILNFSCYQRNPMSNDFKIYDIANNDIPKYVKAVELSWKTSRTLNPTTLINSENVQTARIIIRKQQEN